MTEERALKAISQETFDIVVKENVEEFEMDEEEAVKDAIEQFHSQVQSQCTFLQCTVL